MLRDKYNQLKEKYSDEAVLALVSWLGMADQSLNEDYQSLRQNLLTCLGERELEKFQFEGDTWISDRKIEDYINMAVMVEVMADAPLAE